MIPFDRVFAITAAISGFVDLARSHGDESPALHLSGHAIGMKPMNPVVSRDPASDPFINLNSAGWNDDWQAVFATAAPPGSMPARILVHHRTCYDLITTTGEQSGILSGALRDLPVGENQPAVGDWVAIDRATADPCRIVAQLPRRTCVRRMAVGDPPYAQVIAANVDTVLVVCGLDRDFNLRRLERYLIGVADSGAGAVVVLTKSDLVADAGKAVEACAGITTAPIHAVCAPSGVGIADVAAGIRPGTTVAVVGSSGAGKSSLINALIGKHVQGTGEVRDDDGRGRHTTTARVMLPLPSGAMILDTPGMRTLELVADSDEVSAGFSDITMLAAQCRFRDCRHRGEPGCAVQQAVGEGDLAAGRLTNYHKLLREAGRRQKINECEERRHQRAKRKSGDHLWLDE